MLDGCPCGIVHRTAAWVGEYVRSVIALRGPTVVVSTPEGQWRVPRVFISMHGLKATELPTLAQRYRFEELNHVR